MLQTPSVSALNSIFVVPEVKSETLTTSSGDDHNSSKHGIELTQPADNISLQIASLASLSISVPISVADSLFHIPENEAAKPKLKPNQRKRLKSSYKKDASPSPIELRKLLFR